MIAFGLRKEDGDEGGAKARGGFHGGCLRRRGAGWEACGQGMGKLEG